MQVTLQYAAKHFADIVSAVDRGESVEIKRPGKPGLVLGKSETCVPAFAPKRRILGSGNGQLASLTIEEWQSMKADFDREVWDASIIPVGEV